ncbi:hypothetical protein [Arundinibacter roseus]|uniref:Uncharacterized protein n=1 Tax=Arundinibacter roseus TaxID=2070510 RepID=A0A4R4K9L4_9BACT|nr:hypothetical protein [Arundinibacter roseus]TDB64380.1 hypothetical protein EZE20_11900 [Arundinibacter roseus]
MDNENQGIVRGLHTQLLLLAGAKALFPEICEKLTPNDENGKPFINIYTMKELIDAAFEAMENQVHNAPNYLERWENL